MLALLTSQDLMDPGIRIWADCYGGLAHLCELMDDELIVDSDSDPEIVQDTATIARLQLDDQAYVITAGPGVAHDDTDTDGPADSMEPIGPSDSTLIVIVGGGCRGLVNGLSNWLSASRLENGVRSWRRPRRALDFPAVRHRGLKLDVSLQPGLGFSVRPRECRGPEPVDATCELDRVRMQYIDLMVKEHFTHLIDRGPTLLQNLATIEDIPLASRTAAAQSSLTEGLQRLDDLAWVLRERGIDYVPMVSGQWGNDYSVIDPPYPWDARTPDQALYVPNRTSMRGAEGLGVRRLPMRAVELPDSNVHYMACDGDCSDGTPSALNGFASDKYLLDVSGPGKGQTLPRNILLNQGITELASGQTFGNLEDLATHVSGAPASAPDPCPGDAPCFLAEPAAATDAWCLAAGVSARLFFGTYNAGNQDFAGFEKVFWTTPTDLAPSPRARRGTGSAKRQFDTRP